MQFFKKICVSMVGVNFMLLLLATNVHAGPLTNAQTNLKNAIAPTELASDLNSTVATIIKGVLALVGTIFFILTIYAGVLWMTAQGAAEQIEKSTGILKGAIIGLAITMSAYAITVFVTGKLNP